jgi:hypothetical protein
MRRGSGCRGRWRGCARILAKRGVTAPESAIGSILLGNAVMRAPEAISAVAGTIAAPASGALSTPPALIAKSTLKTMTWGKAQWAAGATIATAAVVMLVIWLWPAPLGTSEVVRTARPAPRPPVQRAARTAGEIEAEYARKIKTVPRLNWAVAANDMEAVKQFLAAGDNPDTRFRDGQDKTALNEAAMLPLDSGYEIVKLLLDKGADVNARNASGNAPIMAAVRHRSPRTIELLLSRGATLAYTNVRRETALDWAKQVNDPEMLRIIEEAMVAEKR